ncbi:unnamed protein product [marine sediment metagenome]|uniref:Uncharacterized protein n=1 Tax=marine sediment metagenome TaxID=412755 RepID=X1CF96_9ZZZZ
MTLKKWTVCGVIVIALACILAGHVEAGGVAIAGLVGFLKSDED